MPGWNNADNKFGLTPYIVGTTLGDGCNYTSIQTAINDAFAAGGGVIGIRPGTYVENLTLQSGVELYGFDVDGRLPSALSKVVIQGNHTFTVAGGFGAQLSQYINFSALAGDAFTVNATGGGQAILAMKFCGIEASTVAGQRACVLNADGTSGAQFSTDNTNVFSDSHCFESIGLGSHAAALNLGVSGSNTGDVFRHSSGSGSLNLSYHNSNANVYIFNGVATNGNCFWEFSRVNCGQEAILFSAGASQAQVFNCEIGSSATSGFWIDGLNGQLDYVNVGFTASITDIGSTITQSIRDWQPYAQSGASGSPVTVAPRGTASFNSTQFSVVDGFVQAISSGIFPWNDIGGPATVLENTGTFAINSGISLTLPGTPVQGDTCAFKAIAGVTGIIITANVGQSLLVGSSSGSTATNTAQGDAMELTYHASSSVWIANSIVGNWIIA